MDLTEHQAKKILHEAGIRVPKGAVASSPEEATSIYRSLGLSDCVVKAQIRAGGRSQGYFKTDSQARNGIRFVTGEEQVKANSTQMLNNFLVTEQTGLAGELVQSVYLENSVAVQSEKYLALTIDDVTGSLVFIASNAGGVGIESLALKSPDLIKHFAVDIRTPVVPAGLTEFFQIADPDADQFNQMCSAMLSLLIDKDATLIEFNPFGISEQGELVVLDAAITWDDNALFRQGHEEQMLAYDHLSESEFKAICQGLNYVQLEGNIGTLSSGAGLAMAVLDALHDAGGKSANFLDVPPSSSVSDIEQALSLVLLNKNLDVLLINVIGGGIMRCDAVTDALLLVNEKQGWNIPVVARLAGTNATLAIQRLSASIPNLRVTDDLATAIATAVDLANKDKYADKSDKSAQKSWWRRRANSQEVDVN